jgi:hypothetical protein
MIKICSKCKIEKLFTEFHKHKSEKHGLQRVCIICQKEYVLKNKEKVYGKRKIWTQNNKEKSKKYKSKWRLKNPNYHKNWLDSDIKNKITHNLRCRINVALKRKTKSKKTIELIGTSIENLWIHLEKSFKPGMTRENYGKWHIDHIRPCSSFDLSKPEEQSICFHYSNLMPLWAEENLKKGSKLNYEKE